MVNLIGEDILDEFQNSSWLLLNKEPKNCSIKIGEKIRVRNKKAIVNEVIFGRKDRLALKVSYEEIKDEKVENSSLSLANL